MAAYKRYFCGLILALAAIYAMIFIMFLDLMHMTPGELFGGIPVSEVLGDLNLLALAAWLWIYIPLMAVSMFHVDMSLGLSLISMTRYGSKKSWYKALLKELFILFAVSVVIIGAAAVRLYVADPLWSVVIISIHGLLNVSFILFLRFIWPSSAGAFFGGLLLEVLVYCVGEELPRSTYYMWTNWGMPARMLSDGTGMTALTAGVMVVEIVLIAIFVMTGYAVIYRRGKDHE